MGEQESRVLVLDDRVRLGLVRSAQDPFLVDAAGLMAMLPSGLTPEEVDQIGLQVSTSIEDIDPSRDGVKNGNRGERDLIFSVGLAAINTGDTVTAESVVENLSSGRNRWNVRSRMGAHILRKELELRTARS